MKERKIEVDPLARFKNLYRASYAGDEVLVAGITPQQAAEEAAGYFGVTEESFRESGTLTSPSWNDVTSYCRRHGKWAEMLVQNQKYGEVVVTAICRDDALLQAAGKLGTTYGELLNTDTRVFMSGRIKYYEKE